MVDLRGVFESSVPHIMIAIVPQQMVLDGDPNRRSCEQSEAIGVDLKCDLHKRCARITLGLFARYCRAEEPIALHRR